MTTSASQRLTTAPAEAYGQPWTMTSEHWVCAVPETDQEFSSWLIRVCYRGEGRWAVQHGSQVLSRAGQWVFPPGSDGRDEAWLAEHRFDLETALRLAKEHAPLVRVNGRTAEGLRDWRAAHGEFDVLPAEGSAQA